MSSSKNQEFEKTSFLNKSNSAFIEQMYLKFINKDKNLPESWLNYFEQLGDELNIIAKEINRLNKILYLFLSQNKNFVMRIILTRYKPI